MHWTGAHPDAYPTDLTWVHLIFAAHKLMFQQQESHIIVANCFMLSLSV